MEPAPEPPGGPPDKAIRVAIVEDVRDIREGLAVLIGGTPGYRCVGTYASMEEALRGISAQAPPDLVLVDLGLPGMSGIEGIRILKERHPGMVLVVLTVYDDDLRIVNALCAGASGYLLKRTPPSKLLEGLKEAYEGGGPMSPEVASRVIELFREGRPPEAVEHRLTPHELRLLKLLVDGHQYKTAAAELNVSLGTIRFHMQQIYRKLQVHSKSEAVARALRGGLVR